VKRIILPGVEYVALLMAEIKPYAGLAAEITDHTPFMQAVLDDYLNGTPLKDPKSFLKALSVPTDVAEYLIKSIQDDIASQFAAAFHPVRPSSFFVGVVTESGDFYIDEHTHSAQTPTFVEPTVDQVLDDGGWCSEKERRKAGIV